jgi:hypothetical protein
MSKNRCSFNELNLEGQNSLTPYLKKEGTAKQAIHLMIATHPKVPTKSEDQFDLLEVEFQMNERKPP